MRRYSRDEEERIRAQAAVREWTRSRLLDPSQGARLEAELRVDVRRTNNFLRAGLALFTALIVGASVLFVITGLGLNGEIPIAAVTGAGKTVGALGAPDTVTFLRSSGKPFQALPLLVSGAADRLGFTVQEIAIACGSHSGEPIHVAAARSMLAKAGLTEDDLRCGAHAPYNVQSALDLAAAGIAPGQIHNNCSGKHAGILALAMHLAFEYLAF